MQTDCFYRISVKAVIKNDKGEVLVVKEKGSRWCLPGGGMDHGEDTMAALKRELKEEVNIDCSFTVKILAAEPIHVEKKGFWQLWLVYEVEPESYEASKGVDADEVAYVDPNTFKDSESSSEQLVYRHAATSSKNAGT